MGLIDRVRQKLQEGKERRAKERAAKSAFTAYAIEAVRTGQADSVDAALDYAATKVEEEFGADPQFWEFLNRLLDTFGPLLVELLRSLLVA